MPPRASARVRWCTPIRRNRRSARWPWVSRFSCSSRLQRCLKAFRAAVDLKADPQLSASVPIRGPGTLADFASLVLEPDGVAEANRYLAASRRRHAQPLCGRDPGVQRPGADGGDPKPQVEEQLKRLLLGALPGLSRAADSAAWHRTSVATGSASRPTNCGGPSDAARLLKLHAPALQQAVALLSGRESPRGSKSTSTGCATTSTAARTTHYAIVWTCRWERSSRRRIASST